MDTVPDMDMDMDTDMAMNKVKNRSRQATYGFITKKEITNTVRLLWPKPTCPIKPFVFPYGIHGLYMKEKFQC